MSTKDIEEPIEEPEEGVDDDEMFRRRERVARDRDDRGRPQLTDFVRRVVENTVGQVQNTGSAGRDTISYLLQQGDRGRREVVRIVAKEVGDFLRATDLSSEAVKVLTRVRLEVNASISFKPTDDGRGVQPEVDSGSQVKVMDPEGRDYLEEDDDDFDDDGVDDDPDDIR